MTLRPPNSATPYASRPRCAPGQRSGSGSRRDCRTRSRRDRRCLGGRTGCRRDPAPVGPHRHPHTHRRRARAPYDRPRCRRRSSPAPEPLTGYPLRTRTELDAFGLDARYGCEAIQVSLTAPHRPAVRRRHEDEPHHVRWRPSGRLITPTYRCSTWSSTGSAGRPSRCGPLPPRLASGCRSWARTRHSTRLLPRRQHSRQSSPRCGRGGAMLVNDSYDAPSPGPAWWRLSTGCAATLPQANVCWSRLPAARCDEVPAALA